VIAVRTVAAEYVRPDASADERAIYLDVYLDFEFADIYDSRVRRKRHWQDLTQC
jgi:hypothetical protein